MTLDPSSYNSMIVTVTGPDDQLGAFAQWCMTLEHLSSIGASRTMQQDVDGDGSADLRFDFGQTDVSDVALPTDEDLDSDTIVVPGIGE